MAGPWLVLVGTRAAFFDHSSIIAQVERLPGRWYTEQPPNPLPRDVAFHFWYLPSASTAQLADISSTRLLSAVIVAPESLPKNVKAEVKVRIGAGTNNVEIGDNEVCLNTPGINSDATAEWTFRSLLWAYGGASPESIAERTIRGELTSSSQVFDNAYLYNHELTGRCIAILGGGNIAQEFAALCKARHMRVRMWSSAKGDSTMMGLDLISSDLDTVLKDAEIVSLHVPLVTDPGPRNTVGVLNESRMRILKRGALLLNFARPQLIDSDVLLRVMLDGQVSKAVIDGDLFRAADGTESGPLVPFVNIVRANKEALGGRLMTLPHIGGDTSEEARLRGMQQAVRQVHDALTRARLVNLVRPIPPPFAYSSPVVAQMPPHIGAASLSQVRQAIRSEKSQHALQELQAVIGNSKLVAEADDATLKRLLKSLRTLAEELPLERRIDG